MITVRGLASPRPHSPRLLGGNLSPKSEKSGRDRASSSGGGGGFRPWKSVKQVFGHHGGHQTSKGPKSSTSGTRKSSPTSHKWIPPPSISPVGSLRKRFAIYRDPTLDASNTTVDDAASALLLERPPPVEYQDDDSYLQEASVLDESDYHSNVLQQNQQRQRQQPPPQQQPQQQPHRSSPQKGAVRDFMAAASGAEAIALKEAKARMAAVKQKQQRKTKAAAANGGTSNSGGGVCIELGEPFLSHYEVGQTTTTTTPQPVVQTPSKDESQSLWELQYWCGSLPDENSDHGTDAWTEADELPPRVFSTQQKTLTGNSGRTPSTAEETTSTGGPLVQDNLYDMDDEDTTNEVRLSYTPKKKGIFHSHSLLQRQNKDATTRNPRRVLYVEDDDQDEETEISFVEDGPPDPHAPSKVPPKTEEGTEVIFFPDSNSSDEGQSPEAPPSETPPSEAPPSETPVPTEKVRKGLFLSLRGGRGRKAATTPKSRKTVEKAPSKSPTPSHARSAPGTPRVLTAPPAPPLSTGGNPVVRNPSLDLSTLVHKTNEKQQQGDLPRPTSVAAALAAAAAAAVASQNDDAAAAAAASPNPATSAVVSPTRRTVRDLLPEAGSRLAAKTFRENESPLPMEQLQPFFQPRLTLSMEEPSVVQQPSLVTENANQFPNLELNPLASPAASLSSNKLLARNINDDEDSLDLLPILPDETDLLNPSALKRTMPNIGKLPNAETDSKDSPSSGSHTDEYYDNESQDERPVKVVTISTQPDPKAATASKVALIRDQIFESMVDGGSSPVPFDHANERPNSRAYAVELPPSVMPEAKMGAIEVVNDPGGDGVSTISGSNLTLDELEAAVQAGTAAANPITRQPSEGDSRPLASRNRLTGYHLPAQLYAQSSRHQLRRMNGAVSPHSLGKPLYDSHGNLIDARYNSSPRNTIEDVFEGILDNSISAIDDEDSIGLNALEQNARQRSLKDKESIFKQRGSPIDFLWRAKKKARTPSVLSGTGTGTGTGHSEEERTSVSEMQSSQPLRFGKHEGEGASLFSESMSERSFVRESNARGRRPRNVRELLPPSPIPAVPEIDTEESGSTPNSKEDELNEGSLENSLASSAPSLAGTNSSESASVGPGCHCFAPDIHSKKERGRRGSRNGGEESERGFLKGLENFARRTTKSLRNLWRRKQ